MVTYRRISLKGIECLKGQKISGGAVENVLFPLKETTPEELHQARRRNSPTFVLKVRGKLYSTKIPRELNLVAIDFIGPHLCANTKTLCYRLTGNGQKSTVCPKVIDGAIGIEKYSWIETGYETFGTDNHDVFAVVDCLRFLEIPDNNRKNIVSINKEELLDIFFGKKNE